MLGCPNICTSHWGQGGNTLEEQTHKCALCSVTNIEVSDLPELMFPAQEERRRREAEDKVDGTPSTGAASSVNPTASGPLCRGRGKASRSC